MANILLLDDNDVAGRAMMGILARGHHRCVVAAKVDTAWDYLRKLVKIDLVIAETALQSGDGTQLIQRLREDPFLKQVPVVVYTRVEDHRAAARPQSMGVQNYLLKPYNDEAVHGEVSKACAFPWRIMHFEEEKSFCAQMGMSHEDLRKQLKDLAGLIEESVPLFAAWSDGKPHPEAIERMTALSDSAQAVGFWGLVECLQALQAKVEARSWDALKASKESLEFALRLLFCHLNPDHLPEGLISEREHAEQREAKERDFWMNAKIVETGPLVGESRLKQQLDALGGCPVIDTTAAGFAMAADGRAPSMNHLMDLVTKDPALSAEVLIAANKLERENPSPVEDPRLAVSLLGSLKLSALAKAMPTVPERHMQCSPMSWSQFWMFQVAVGRLSEFTCQQLDFQGELPQAYTAGLLHDLGKLVLLKLYPYGFRAIVEYSRRESVPLHEAERKYLGWTMREMGYHLATKNGLPAVYCNVMRWVEMPEVADADVDLVAAVSLARDLCLHNHVGYCGDTPGDRCPPIEETTAWQVLQNRVFPGFNLRGFEAQAHSFCAALKQELLGKLT